MAETDSAEFCSIAVGITTKCSLCCKEVTVDSEPYLLPCLHTACQECLANEDETHRCSFCDHSFRAKQAVRHLVLLERLEKESPKDKDGDDEAVKNYCTSCDETQFAAGYCRDCEEWLCDACITAHQRVKLTKDHSILSTEMAGRALKTAAKNKFQMCEKHSKEALKFHCTKCDVLTCRDCQLEEHQNHGDYLLLSKAWKQQEPHIKILQERIAEKQEFLREYIARLESLQEKNGMVESAVVQEIKAFTVRAISMISGRSKQLIREVMAMCEQKRETLQYKRHDYMQLCKRLQDCHATSEELIASGSDLALVHSRAVVEKCMQGLIDKVVQLPNSRADIEIKFNCDEKIWESLDLCGNIVDLSTLPVRSGGLANFRSVHNGLMRFPSTSMSALNSKTSSSSPQHSASPKIATMSPKIPDRPKSNSSSGSASAAAAPVIKQSSSPARQAEPVTANPAPADTKEDMVITGDVEALTATKPPSPEQTVHEAEAEGGAGSTTGTTAEDNDGSDDWCAVCHDGGELLCCGLCPKVYHLHCHVPALVSTPGEDWRCTLCTPIQEDAVVASKDGNSKRKIPVGLSGKQLKLTEKILLQLFCHSSSTPFQTPVSRTVPNYFKIITRPMDLSTVKQKLSTSHFNHYESATAFIRDIRLIFDNCYLFNAKESQLSKQAQNLEEYFRGLIKKELPECLDDVKSPASDELMNESKRVKLS